mmetsp:Transcript_11793/g.26296  ORF Transcript_11793/g.26296 Transcript_11793/m.26296 type:complete len:217 (-) Transcript_11793:80-730(-)
MGQSLDLLKNCDGVRGRERPQGDIDNQANSDEDPHVGCDVIQDSLKHALATANRGGSKISNEVLLNHELLQHARQGNVSGLSTALEKGAWTETRRPLVMKPQKRDPGTGQKVGRDGQDMSNVGMTALMFSAQAGAADCVRRLMWAGAEVNAHEEDGWTALHFAAKDGHLEVCTQLLRGRADAQMVNADEQTALQVAEAEDSEFAAKLAAVLAKPSS